MSIIMAAGRGGRGRAFTDDRGKVWTPTGVAQTVFSPSRFGGGALDLSATAGDSLLTTSALADFSFPGMFTIDFWLFWTGQAGVIFTAEGLGGLSVKVNANGSLTASEFAVADFLTTLAAEVTANTWMFVSLSRDASAFVRFHVNGNNIGGTTYPSGFTTPGVFNLGAYFSGSAENPTIYLDDFRVTNGATRYGQPNYAPPSGQAPNGPTDPFWPNVVSLLRFNN